MDELRRDLSWRISVAARLQRTRFDEHVRTMGITLAQWRALDAVHREEGATQRRIAEMLDVGDVTASRLIDRLVEKLWIKRLSDPGDRRAHRLYLTDDAMPVLAELTVLGREAQRATFADIGEADGQMLRALLDRVIANLEAGPTPVLTAQEE